MFDVEFRYGEYDDMDGFWVDIVVLDVKKGDNEVVVAGGHFNTQKEVFRFYLKSKKYFGKSMEGQVKIK